MYNNGVQTLMTAYLHYQLHYSILSSQLKSGDNLITI